MPVPYPAPPAVGVAVEFVPPLAMGSVPVTPVVRGRPVAFVKTAAEGVPRAGVTNVGLVAKTMLPEPVTACPRAVWTPVPSAVMPVPPAVIGRVPEVSAEVDVAYRAPPEVNEPSPVPPYAVPTTPEVIWLPLIAIDVLDADVSWPWALTANVGTEDADP